MLSVRKKLAGIALGVGLVGSGAAGAYALTGTASAQDASTTTAPSTSSSSADNSTTNPSAATPAAPDTDNDGPRGAFDPSKGGHVGHNGVKEELLTGDTAEKVKAAALAAVPGGTIERVENDAEGATYEAHMTKADGSHVTVKLDASFNVTSVENGR
ncbi:MAG: hypothetical protein QOJ19_1898 [Acidimicrobiia bacterium]|jgi:uncharacterized membrane protein YkoI|nr:hypothetical protein [Acidimicrobiia bacterium]